MYVMLLNAPNDELDIRYSKMNGTEFDKATEYKHIGVLRCADIKTANRRLIDDIITRARRTAYALMLTGFHGHDILNPNTPVYIYNTYVLPRLLYGLETVNLQNDIEKLDKFPKDILRRIQHLPERTAL